MKVLNIMLSFMLAGNNYSSKRSQFFKKSNYSRDAVNLSLSCEMIIQTAGISLNLLKTFTPQHKTL